jgi:hypothetical protein
MTATVTRQQHSRPHRVADDLFSVRLALEAERVGAELDQIGGTPQMLQGPTPRRVYDMARRLLPTLDEPARADAVPRAIDQAAVELGLSEESRCPPWCDNEDVTGAPTTTHPGGGPSFVADLQHISESVSVEAHNAEGGDDEGSIFTGIRQAITPEAAARSSFDAGSPHVFVSAECGLGEIHLSLDAARSFGQALVRLADEASAV